MNSSISNFLKGHYVDTVYSTHVSMTNPKGNFQINRESSEILWDKYQKELREKGDDLVIGLAEKPTNYLPVILDADIMKYDDEIKNFVIYKDNLGYEHLYSEKNLKDIVGAYQSVLRNIIDECTDEHLTCVVLEKQMYFIINKKGIKIWKSGFHLHFPFAFLSKTEQETHVIPRVKDILKELNIFENLNIEDSSSIIDTSYLSVPWLIYGCRKDGENMRPYKVTKVYDSECNIISLDKAFRYYQLYNVKEQLIDITGKIEENLPRILSILPYGRECSELKYGLPLPKKDNIVKIKEKRERFESDDMDGKNLLLEAKKLLPMLADFRAEDRNEWISIGWLLYNIGEGSNDALELWIEFSSRCEDKFDEKECIDIWDKMTKKNLTIRTLHYYAKIDNEDLYNEYKKEKAENIIKQSLEGSHNDIAKLLYSEYSEEFVCANIPNNTWYQFKNHKWVEIEEGVYLREKISSHLTRIYGDFGAKLFNATSGCIDKTEDSIYQSRITQTKKIISNLKNSCFKSNVMKEAKDIFYYENFTKKLDVNPYLIGFKNGVYDLKLNVFRAGRPEDFLSKAMPISFVNFNKNDERVKDVYDYLEKVFPDKSVRQYFLDTTSDVFVGGNQQKIGIFWTGEGDNAKSVTQTILEKMLGEYAIKISTTLLTGKKTNIGGASPELARAAGTRWAVFEEPDKDEVINTGIFKSITGNDTYWARDLFEKGKNTKEIVPLFMSIFISNSLPRFKGGGDKAVWNRVKVIPFESTFVRAGEPCPETYEEQLLQKRFPMDTQFSDKIPALLEAFAWVLLEHRKSILGKGRIEPEKVKMATALYRKQNDIYRQFVDECIVEAQSYLTAIQLYTGFREWYKMSFPGNGCPPKNEVEEYFVKLWNSPQKGGKWFGYRIRTLDEDIEDGLALELTEDDLIDYSDTKSVKSASC
jgi:P4 family phage/plasmid primase-like protien